MDGVCRQGFNGRAERVMARHSSSGSGETTSRQSGLAQAALEAAATVAGVAMAVFDRAAGLQTVSSGFAALWERAGLGDVPHRGDPLSGCLARFPERVRLILNTGEEATLACGAALIGIRQVRFAPDPAEEGRAAFSTLCLWDAMQDQTHARALTQVRAHARTQEDRLLQAIEVMNDGFALFDAEDRLVLSNRPYRKILQRLTGAVHPGAPFADILQAVMREGLIDLEGLSEEAWVLRRKALHQSPHGVMEVRLTDGRTLAIWEARTPNSETVMILSDITLRRRAERAVANSEMRYRQLAEVSPDLIAVSVGGFLRYINPAGIAILGQGEGGVLGHRLSDFVDPDYRGVAERLCQDDAVPGVAGGHAPEPVDWVAMLVVRPDGSRAFVEVAAVGFHDGSRQGVMLVGRDLTGERQAKEAAIQRQHRLEAIMEAVVDGIVTTDAEGRIEHLNRAAEQMFGHASVSVAGQSLAVLVDGFTLGGEDWTAGSIEEGTGRRATGTTFPVEVSVSGVQLGGQVLHIVVVRDISERQRAERALRSSEARYALAVSGTNEAIWDWDIVSDRVYFSPHARDLLGVDIDRIPRGRDWQGVIHPEDRGRFQTELIRHLRGESTYFSCEYRLVGNLDDRERWVRHRGLALRDTINRAWRMAGSVGDISEYHAALENLREAKEQAELASRSKTEFLANIGHELRTPLNAIIGFSEVIMSGMLGPVQPPQYGDYARDIMDSGRHLLDVINDILDVSRIDVGMMVLQPESVDLRQIADSALRLISVRATAAGVHLKGEFAETVPPVWGEGRRLKQVLVNLLGNAVKFTPEGGSVTLRLFPDPEGDAVVLAVSDTGIGMAAEDIPVALTPFRQVDSRLARKFEGTGLGLPLSKSFVELHGGTMSIQSALDKGTEVTVRLPATQPHSLP